MPRSATFRILISYEVYERFAATIRPQEMSGWESAQSKPEFDIDCGFGKPDWPGHPHLWEQAAKSHRNVASGEQCDAGTRLEPNKQNLKPNKGMI